MFEIEHHQKEIINVKDNYTALITEIGDEAERGINNAIAGLNTAIASTMQYRTI